MDPHGPHNLPSGEDKLPDFRRGNIIGSVLAYGIPPSSEILEAFELLHDIDSFHDSDVESQSAGNDCLA